KKDAERKARKPPRFSWNLGRGALVAQGSQEELEPLDLGVDLARAVPQIVVTHELPSFPASREAVSSRDADSRAPRPASAPCAPQSPVPSSLPPGAGSVSPGIPRAKTESAPEPPKPPPQEDRNGQGSRAARWFGATAGDSRWRGCARSSPASPRTPPRRAGSKAGAAPGGTRPAPGHPRRLAALEPAGCRAPSGHKLRKACRRPRGPHPAPPPPEGRPPIGLSPAPPSCPGSA